MHQTNPISKEETANALHSYESLKKTELELTLDEFISENADQYSSDTKLQPYFASRARTAGSPVKKEAPELKVSKRRTKTASDEATAVE